MRETKQKEERDVGGICGTLSRRCGSGEGRGGGGTYRGIARPVPCCSITDEEGTPVHRITVITDEVHLIPVPIRRLVNHIVPVCHGVGVAAIKGSRHNEV